MLRENSNGRVPASVLLHRRELLTIGSENRVTGRPTRTLDMRGGEVFSFVAGLLPGLLADLKNQLSETEWDRVFWFVHQGSRLAVSQVVSVLDQPEESLFRAESYENVVSSSTPFQLQDNWKNVRRADFIGLVTFGVGMAVSVSVLAVRGTQTILNELVASRRFWIECAS